MRLLFEEHQYEPALIEKIFRDLADVEQDLITKKVSLGWVGYFYCQAEEDCVFILPKVLLKDDKELGEIIAGVEREDGTKVRPEDIITPEGQETNLTKEYRKFIYEFAVWVYRSINMYRKQVKDQKSIYYKPLPTEGRGKKHEARTMLDVILSLIRFNKENQNFFMFVIKNQHTGMNKINWTRTISHSQAFIQGGSPIYLDPVNKKRQINFDEELIIIFFSILNYLNEQFGFKTPINCNYDLITDNRFQNYRKGHGRKRLLAIKYKYFSDKALELWHLCMAFFDSTHVIDVNTAQQDFLLAKNFEHVFEAMIDYLIGTPHDSIPKGLADQDDGKMVDHMYTYKSLTSTDDNEKDEVYYIGDSKYYKSGHTLGKESVAKQYTYARNVIQWNIDLFMNPVLPNWTQEDKAAYNADKAKFGNIELRKSEEEGNATEGYNVIPNFFLSAFVYDDRQYDDHKGNLKLHHNGKKIEEHSTYIKYQFCNRLFDRDTLILSHYDVNFLYVLYLYARNKSAERTAWCVKVREMFRDEIREVLMNKFNFYAMKPHTYSNSEEDMGREYIRKNFQRVLGKIYNPYEDNNIYALALSKEANEQESNDALLQELRKYFYVTDEPVKLGEDPKKLIDTKIEQTGHILHKKQKQGILVGLVPDDEHWAWIKENGTYNIRLDNATEREGSLPYSRELILVNRIVLYRLVDDTPQFVGIYDLLDENSLPQIYNFEEMRKFENLGKPYPYGNIDEAEKRKREYIIYEIDLENHHTLTDADKQYYAQLIMSKGTYEVDGKTKTGKPFVV